MSQLRPCPACQKSVSMAAKCCPGCGHPFELSKTKEDFAGKIIIVVVLVIFALIYLLWTLAHTSFQSA